MKSRHVKALTHGFLVIAAVIELKSASSNFRRALCGGFAGFHAVQVWNDLTDPEENEDLSDVHPPACH